MFPYQLAKCELLTNAFGESRVFETIRQLKEAGLFPTREHITVNDLSTLVYCLSCTTSAKTQTSEYLDKYFLLQNSVDGMPLSDAIIMLILNNEFLDRLIQTAFYKESGKVVMLFQMEGHQEAILYTYEDSTPDTGVSTYTMIEGSWWRELKAFASKINLEMATNQNAN